MYAYVVGGACQVHPVMWLERIQIILGPHVLLKISVMLLCVLKVISKMDWHSNLFYARPLTLNGITGPNLTPNLRLDDINEYMQENKIPDDMALKVRQYFHFARQTDKDTVHFSFSYHDPMYTCIYMSVIYSSSSNP